MASACGVRLSRGGDGVDDALAIVAARDGFDDLFAGPIIWDERLDLGIFLYIKYSDSVKLKTLNSILNVVIELLKWEIYRLNR